MRTRLWRIAIAAALALVTSITPGGPLSPLFDAAPDAHAGEPRRRHRRKSRHPRDDSLPPADTTFPPAPPPAASVHLALGAPVDADPSDDWLMQKPQYALSYNPKRLGPNWVSWELNASYYGGAPRHKGHFLADDSLPPGWPRVQHEDYSHTEFDRGHMVRSEERTRSREDNDSTFLLTNILPQRHDLNGGPWLRLEEYCQQLAQNGHKEMFVTAGPIFGPAPPIIGRGVAVPEAFFKIIIVLDQGAAPADITPSTRVIAVIMPNATGILGEPWGRYRTSVAEIERRSGYRFFPAVPDPPRAGLIAGVDAGPSG